MQIVNLEDFDKAKATIMIAVEAGTRETTGKTLRATQRNLTRRGPKKSGRFRGSVMPYADNPTVEPPPENQAFYPIAGDDVVDQVMQGWAPGREVGTASELPYSRRLAHGWSKQAPDGWVDVAVADAISEVEAQPLEASA